MLEKIDTNALNETDIVVFMGTWCHDSKREVPRLYKILDGINYDYSKFEIIGLKKNKTGYFKDYSKFNVKNTPTLIFFQNKREIGRIIEKPKKSLESNIQKIKINSFFNKKNKTIKSNFLIEGNTIQKKIWRELTKIKIGKTKSYGEIAKKFKLSPRHVGKICGQNKIPLAIPCHRVIRSDGTMGGFSAFGGIILKKKLLNFENSWK